MFQDISPFVFDNQYRPREIENTDYLVVLDGERILLLKDENDRSLPRYSEIPLGHPLRTDEKRYLFSVDDMGFFFVPSLVEPDGYDYYDKRFLRDLQPSWAAFAGATAFHVAHWYLSHAYCGLCTAKTMCCDNEHAVYCPRCGHKEYPTISPVVMVGIVDRGSLLLTRYAFSGYKGLALVAGFVETGETLEDAVRREVMEEVGLQVKNIRYYKSQPWAFSESLLVGFFADVDGDASISLDEQELSEAGWYSRGDIPAGESTLSLTWDMIEYFRNG